MTGATVAVGFFDGVHLGHRRILDGADRALTFRNHPAEVLAPDRVPPLLMPFDDRAAAIRALGVREVTALDFTPELAATPPEEFAAKWLAGARRVRCGENWRFGAGGAGDADFLRSMGIAVEVAPYATCRGERISSTRIRAALASGDVALANEMLGRRWTVAGDVFRGKGLGSSIGFPTVNARLPAFLPRLPLGVYEVEALGARAVANWGVAPTMGDRAWATPVLEIHFVDAPPDDLDASPRLAVSFLRFLRPERRFASVDELRSQLAADCGAIMV